MPGQAVPHRRLLPPALRVWSFALPDRPRAHSISQPSAEDRLERRRQRVAGTHHSKGVRLQTHPCVTAQAIVLLPFVDEERLRKEWSQSECLFCR